MLYQSYMILVLRESYISLYMPQESVAQDVLTLWDVAETSLFNGLLLFVFTSEAIQSVNPQTGYKSKSTKFVSECMKRLRQIAASIHY